MTHRLPADPDGIARAAALIRAGEPVAVPTETVYGLAADARSDAAVAAVYAAKGRPAFNPLIVHVADVEAAMRIARFDAAAHALAARFWPGPLTLVLPVHAEADIAPLVRAGLPSVALRVPAHPAMRALIAASGCPLAAPSANASGRISPTRAEHVLASLDGRIPLVLDGGETAHGLESTIVAPIETEVRLLRPGPITPEAIAEATGLPVRLVENGAGDAATVEAPGQLLSHYAPSKPVRLDVTEAREGEWLIGFGAVAGHDTLSARGDLVEAAARLFAALHRADASSARAIAVAPLPRDGLGLALTDRLTRAAAGR